MTPMKCLVLTMAVLMSVAMLASSSADKNSSKKSTNDVAKASQDKTKSEQQTTQSQSGEQTSSGEQLSGADKMFLKTLIEEDISEINLAHMALKKASSQEVKDYAQTKILDADPEMRNGAEKIAKAHGVKVPSEPNMQEKKEHQKLSKMQGKYFDNAYMNYEASKQAGDYEVVEKELKATSNSEVKSFVQNQEQPVKEAAQAAKQLSTQISKEMLHHKRPVATAASAH